jgi:hypothetical protein
VYRRPARLVRRPRNRRRPRAPATGAPRGARNVETRNVETETMDPNKTLYDLLNAIAIDDTETVSEAAESLSQWIGRGGFLPDEFDSIAAHLAETVKAYGDDCEYFDFRIYLTEDGDIRAAYGDSSYDQDHRGYCGAGSVAAGDSLDDCRKAVAACLEDAIEFYFTGR